jgi:hypothetical protein
MKELITIFGTFLIASVVLTSCGESKSDILQAEELMRLNKVETEIKQAIADKNYDHAKLLCLSLKWEYILPGNVSDGGTNEEKVILWDEKSRSYLRIMGFDPLEILGEKPKRKTLKEQLRL